MKLQNRAFKAIRTQRDPVEKVAGGKRRSLPLVSSASDCSSNQSKNIAQDGKNGCTILKPSVEQDCTGANPKSTEPVMEPMSVGMVPNELLKMSIKPMGVPLVKSNIEPPLQPITDNEIIVNKLGAIEEKRGPERTWNKVMKYAGYAMRGFGTFGVTIGRGLYGQELQKSLRRQANNLQHVLWGAKSECRSITD